MKSYQQKPNLHVTLTYERKKNEVKIVLTCKNVGAPGAVTVESDTSDGEDVAMSWPYFSMYSVSA